MRDSGPICVANKSGEAAFSHFVFNGGQIFQSQKRRASRHSCQQSSAPQIIFASAQWRPRVLEEAPLMSTDLGTLLTTEECLQSGIQERNPGSEKVITRRFSAIILA